MTLRFEYFSDDDSRELMARGEQEIHCKRRHRDQWVPDVFPTELIEALLSFADEDELRKSLKEAIRFKEAQASGISG